jgi:hypothetical protein
MKKIVDFKNFIMNESNQTDELIKANVNDDVLDQILDSANSEGFLALRDSVPLLYKMLSDRAQFRGFSIDSLISSLKASQYI